jgi:hypothetical protein
MHTAIRTTFTLDETALARLDLLAATWGVSRSAAIRRAIRDGVAGLELEPWDDPIPPPKPGQTARESLELLLAHPMPPERARAIDMIYAAIRDASNEADDQRIMRQYALAGQDFSFGDQRLRRLADEG